MTQRPIIGFDAKRIVRNGSGLGNYGRTLVNDLSSLPLELRLYARCRWREDLVAKVVKRENVVLTSGRSYLLPGRTPLSKLGDAFWRSRTILKDLQADGVQLFHGLSGELPVGISKTHIKSVVTIHDLIFMRHPEYYHWLDTKVYAWKFRQAVREADHIIAISECTKRDIIEFGDVDERKISVIYQSCAPRFTLSTKDYQASQRYILSVGTIEPRKNILLAVKALSLLPETLHLVIAGRHTPYADIVTDYAKSHGLEKRVIVKHNVDDEALQKLYLGAEAFVYPSRYEGFGIPIIEAISCGLPVVACTGSCLEEAGGPDSLYVGSDDVEGMAAAIRKVLVGAEGREGRIRRSREYIRRFEGSDVASQVFELYQCLLRG